MNNENIRRKVRSATYEILKTEVAVSPVELLIKIGILSKKDYEDWRMGRVPYLEKVCRANLSKLSSMMKELRTYAIENNLKPSKTVYMKWGKGGKIRLRFSKYNDPKIEEAYSTHFVDTAKTARTKLSCADKENMNQNSVVSKSIEQRLEGTMSG